MDTFREWGREWAPVDFVLFQVAVDRGRVSCGGRFVGVVEVSENEIRKIQSQSPSRRSLATGFWIA